MPADSKEHKQLEVIQTIDLERENRQLRHNLMHMKNEMRKIQDKPSLVAEVKKLYKNKAIIKLSNGNQFAVNFLKDLKGNLAPQDLVLVEQRSLTIIEKIEQQKNSDVESFLIMEKPTITWEALGGLKDQIRELKEVIELPLKHPEKFKALGITPPKGVILHGPPGCGKTQLAKAVAASTNATFIEIVGSELNQKFIGEGAKLVKDLFTLAREKAPAIIFIDEIDALAAERIDLGTSGEREVQRTFMQFLAELDGFQPLENVKVIAATNRIDILDPAILRPGRFDRLIEVGLPGKEERIDIFKIHSNRMTLTDVDFTHLVGETDGFSGAEIMAVCTEAGYNALREDRTSITTSDFVSAISKLKDEESEEQLPMFG